VKSREGPGGSNNFDPLEGGLLQLLSERPGPFPLRAYLERVSRHGLWLRAGSVCRSFLCPSDHHKGESNNGLTNKEVELVCLCHGSAGNLKRRAFTYQIPSDYALKNLKEASDEIFIEYYNDQLHTDTDLVAEVQVFRTDD